MAAFTRNPKVSQKDLELSTNVLEVLQDNLKRWRNELVQPPLTKLGDANQSQSLASRMNRSP